MSQRIVSLRDTDRVSDILESADVEQIPKEKYTEAELLDVFEGADAAFVHSENNYGRRLFEELESLRVIAKASSGISNIDVEAATENGVTVVFVPGGNRYAVAEYTVALMLSIYRRIPQAVDHLREGGWRSPAWEGSELRGKTIGFVGLGATGVTAAQRLAGFDAELLAYDPYVDQERADEVEATLVDLDELLSRSDIVSMHARLTPETRGIIGAEELSMMNDDAVIVNTARGPLIDEEALVSALENDELRGAAIDVYHDEPPGADHPLIQLDNVVATPHLAGATVETRTDILRTGAKAMSRVLNGQPVDERYVANPETYDL